MIELDIRDGILTKQDVIAENVKAGTCQQMGESLHAIRTITRDLGPTKLSIAWKKITPHPIQRVNLFAITLASFSKFDMDLATGTISRVEACNSRYEIMVQACERYIACEASFPIKRLATLSEAELVSLRSAIHSL